MCQFVLWSTPGGALFNYRHELRVDNPLVGSHQPETVNAGSCDDGAVGGVPQRVSERRHLSGNLDIQWNDLESGPGFEHGEKFLHGDPQTRAALSEQHRDLKQCDSTQGKWLTSADRIAERASLIARKSFRFHEPADQHVSVKQ